MSRIGLLAGCGRFPLFFAKAAKKCGSEVIAVAIKNETSKEINDLVEHVEWFDIGSLQGMIDVFRKAGITKMVMAGGVTKATMFQNIVPDARFLKVFAKVRNSNKANNDDALLRQLCEEFETEGIHVCDSTTYLSVLLPEKGVLTKRQPSDEEKLDIEYGHKIAKQIAGMDIGQTIVLKKQVILAVEAIEGTDKAIMRGGELGRGDVTVVKVARPTQDMRYDIPTVGIETINTLKKAQAKCLAFEEGKTLLLDREEVIRLADEAGIAIVVMPEVTNE